MRLMFVLSLLLPGLAQAAPVLVDGKKPLKPIVTGLVWPESVCIGTDGRTYVTCIGKSDTKGDGYVAVIKDGKPEKFAEGLDDPKGMVAFQNSLYVTDVDKVWRIDAKGKASVHVAADAFPVKPMFLNDIEVVVDNQGRPSFYVSDSGDLKGKGGKIFRIQGKEKKVSVLADEKVSPYFKGTNGLKRMSEYHLLVFDFHAGDLLQTRLSDGHTKKLADGFKGGDGIAFDLWGRTYLTSWSQGKVWVIERPGEKARLLAEGFQTAADCCLSKDGKSILVPDMKEGTLYSIPVVSVDERPLPVQIVPAFADVEWTGFKGVDDKGRIQQHRPILLTHAGDGSNRVFVGIQQGVIHVVPDTAKKEKSKVFLDITDRVRYEDKENEEGFLGLAFPPDYKSKGEFYVYYTPKRKTPKDMKNRVSRFKVSKDDPNKADPASEEVLLELPKPFWNHDGGTLAFGPDGMLYIAVGDGGAANDPFNNGQDLTSLLGKVLRIDVSRKGDGKPYAIPKDNPFVATEKARPEIWAYGLRNIWRMSFDRKTGTLWAGEVGQNLWEEINLIERGGNYGWKMRESFHPFGHTGVRSDRRKDHIDPIWEYHHDLGKSITGGHVYRGKQVPALDGVYLYADYVTGHIWGLKYDEKSKKVTANHWLRTGGFPVYSFGEDEKGEVYLMTQTPTGKGIFRFAKK